MKLIRLIGFLGVIVLIAPGCTISSHSMKTPSNYIQFSKSDFEYSAQVSGEATEVKIIGIDWARIFDRKDGEIEGSSYVNIPIIGGIIGKRVNNYALYNMIKDNPGYDIVLYPQFETQVEKKILMKTTKVKVTARLGKLKQ